MSNFDQSQRNTIWNNYFGSKNSGTDAYGRNVTKNNFEADHIWPLSNGGKTVVTNGMPLHPDSNAEKGHDMNGYVNDNHFHIQGTVSAGVTNVEGIAYDNNGER